MSRLNCSILDVGTGAHLYLQFFYRKHSLQITKINKCEKHKKNRVYFIYLFVYF